MKNKTTLKQRIDAMPASYTGCATCNDNAKTKPVTIDKNLINLLTVNTKNWSLV